MLSIILLVQLALCYAQWPVQSVGTEDLKPVPRPSFQPGYPYNNAAQWAEAHNGALAMHDGMDRSINKLLEGLEPPQTDTANLSQDILHTNPESLMERVKKMFEEHRALRNETDALMRHLQYIYTNTAVDEADNHMTIDNSVKYAMSVILRFLLEFYRIFRKEFSQNHNQLTGIDVYGNSYNEAIEVMKLKKNHSPLQIATPFRRSADIFKSILYESVQIVQMKCSASAPNWQCVVVYLANIIGESIQCPNIWYHAFAHLLALEARAGIEDHFVYKVADLAKFKELPSFENIFDLVILTLEELREGGRAQLSAGAVIFTMIADLQDKGYLNCVSLNTIRN